MYYISVVYICNFVIKIFNNVVARETASRTLSKLRSRETVTVTEEGALQLADLKPLVKRGLLPQS